MSSGAYYAGQPYAKTARLTTGDGSRSAPTTISKIFDPTDDTQVRGACQRITVAPVANIASATCIHVFRRNGSTYSWLFDIPVPIQTLAGAGSPVIEQSAANFPKRFPIMVGNGDSLWATVNDTVTGIDVTAQGGLG